MRKLLSIGALGFASLFAVWQPSAANAQVTIGGHRLPSLPTRGGHHNAQHHNAKHNNAQHQHHNPQHHNAEH
jgi:hypothetical protein